MAKGENNVGVRNKSFSDFDKYFGSRVRFLRKSLNLTQDELAKRIDVSKQQVQNIETSARCVSAITLHNLSKSLGVSMDELYTGNDKNGNNRNINNELMDKFKRNILDKVYGMYVDLCQY